MRQFLLLLSLSAWPLYSQIHNRLIKVNAGVSYEQFAHKNSFTQFNDTSQNQFELVTVMPTIAYSHEFVITDMLSISGRIGFQYLNEYYNNQYFGSPFMFLSVNPQVSVFYRNGFEYYVKLQAGITTWFQNTDILPDQVRRFFPDRVNMFTGVTLGGFNYFISDHLGLNLELNIWSPEMVTFGVSYRYFKGDLPEIQDTKEM